jgi:hypothetical protein
MQQGASTANAVDCIKLHTQVLPRGHTAQGLAITRPHKLLCRSTKHHDKCFRRADAHANLGTEGGSSINEVLQTRSKNPQQPNVICVRQVRHMCAITQKWPSTMAMVNQITVQAVQKQSKQCGAQRATLLDASLRRNSTPSPAPDIYGNSSICIQGLNGA